MSSGLRAIFFLLATSTVLRAADAGRVDFNLHIRPLLSDRCYRCHGPDPGSREARLRLDTREGALKDLGDGMAVVAPGHPEKSELIQRIFAAHEDDRMPPADSNLKLSHEEKELLRRWIAEGAEYKPHWSLLPVEKTAPPAGNFIDAHVRARLDRENLAPAPEASRETLLRRVALNLTGLPPTPEEIDTFLADRAPSAYERMVDRMLASPAYGERMALDWLDLARYGDTYGYQADIDRDMSPWRDWVIGAFNGNLRYDDFLRWQLAGDLLPNATREQRLATAFNRLHRQTNEGGSIEEEFRVEYVADRVDTFGTAMLGLTVGCARCHDHKFDPITQRDYYSLFAFFNNIDESGLYSTFTRATPSPALLLWPEEKKKRHAEIVARILQAETKAAAISRGASDEFQAWLRAGGRVTVPAPVAAFSFDDVADKNVPASDPKFSLTLEDGPETVPGREGSALRFSGDNRAVAKGGFGAFKRADPFSFSLWLKPAEAQPRAVVLHHSRAWTDSGSRGYELVLEHGRPFFGLIHFWPGNAIGVRAREPLPVGEWSQLAITYDGSSRAAGVRLYRNGVPLEVEIVRDRLYKEILHRAEWQDREVGRINFALAGRFRDSGFKGGTIDELKIFDVALTAPEVASLFPGASAAPTLDYYAAREHAAGREARADVQALRAEESALMNDVPEIMVMEEMAERRATHLLKRGAYDSPGEPVRPDTPASILPFPADAPRNRLGLAQWLVDRRNPLAARVAVNRVWKLHFGRGIVATPDDFGSQSALPSHPQLLDALAGWFMDNGWDVKALHRLILASATFRQSSHASRELLARDPANVLLARGPRLRLPAEHIRDGALAASGLLVRKLGGPSVKPYQPEGLWEQSGTGKTYQQDKGESLYRRSLYTFWRRTSPPPSMLAFDAVTREVCTAKRDVTATPLQSLVLLNDPQFVEASRVLAARLLQRFPGDEAARVREACRALIARAPDPFEAGVLARLFREQRAYYAANVELAAKFVATGESPVETTLPPADLAAMTALVSAIMNFDEFVVQR